MFRSKGLSSGLLILASVLAMAGCDQTKLYTDQEHVRRAREFQDQGKLNSAVIELKNALQKNPKNSEARWRLGEIYVSQGLGEQAEDELKRAKELGTEYETLKVPMGQALLLQGLYRRVVAEIQPGPTSLPENIPKLLELQGRAQLGLLHFEEGCKLFVEAAEKDPQYVPAYWGLANCAAARGKLDEARADLDKAMKLDGKNSATWALLGDLERRANRFPEAEEGYSSALKYDSNNLEALFARAAIRIDRNDLSGAKEDIDAAFKLPRGHPTANLLRGVLQFKQANLAEAKTSFETALKRSPDYLPAVYWLGLTNLRQANYEEAVRQFGRYTRGVPDAMQAQTLLALTQARLGRRSEAEDTLKALSKVDISDPQVLATLAQAQLWLGDTDRANAYLARAVKQAPEAAALRVDFAATLSQKGERDAAIEQLEDAIHLDPSLVTADQRLITELLRQKQYDRAMSAVEALEKKRPKDPTTFNLKGGVYLGKNDFASARKSFEQAMALETNTVTAATNLARLDLVEGKPEAARSRFESILAKDKTNVQAMLELAAIAAATGQEAEYVGWLDKASQAGPLAARPRILLASFYLRKNDVRKALAMAQEALTIDPQNYQALDLLGTAQLAGSEPRNAAVTYGKLAGLAPNDPGVLYKLATAQAASKDVDQARDSLNKALGIKPDYQYAELLLANLELEAGKYGDALKIAQRIQKQFPQSHSGFALEGNIEMARSQYGPALRAYEKAFAINRNGLFAVSVNQALRAAGKSREADARLQQWLKDQPSDTAARDYLASTYMDAGRNQEAIVQYELLLEADPRNGRVLNNLAWLYQQQKDPRAMATGEKAYQLNPRDPNAMDTLGWILVEQGEAARGLELLKKAADTAPASTAIHYHLAVAWAKSGDKARARQELGDLLTRYKNFPQRQEAQALLKQL